MMYMHIVRSDIILVQDFCPDNHLRRYKGVMLRITRGWQLLLREYHCYVDSNGLPDILESTYVIAKFIDDSGKNSAKETTWETGK